MNKKKQLEKEIKRIEKLFSNMSMLRHYWFVNAVVMGKISPWASLEKKKERFERYLRKRKEKGLPTDRV